MEKSSDYIKGFNDYIKGVIQVNPKPNEQYMLGHDRAMFDSMRGKMPEPMKEK